MNCYATISLIFDPCGLTGLLCVTCTDLAVLAGSAYPEKWQAPSILRPCFRSFRWTNFSGLEYQFRQLWRYFATS